MTKFTPYEKLSKKEQKKISRSKRGTWGDISPVTRKSENKKAYNRKRAGDWKKQLPTSRSWFYLSIDDFHRLFFSQPVAIKEKSKTGFPV